MSDTISYEDLGIDGKHEVCCSICSETVGKEPIEHVMIHSKLYIYHISCIQKMVDEWRSKKDNKE